MTTINMVMNDNGIYVDEESIWNEENKEYAAKCVAEAFEPWMIGCEMIIENGIKYTSRAVNFIKSKIEL